MTAEAWEPEHVTDDGPCWCGAVPDENGVVIHRRVTWVDYLNVSDLILDPIAGAPVIHMREVDG